MQQKGSKQFYNPPLVECAASILPQLQRGREVEEPINVQVERMDGGKGVELHREDGLLVVHPLGAGRGATRVRGDVAEGSGRGVEHHGQLEQAGLKAAAAVDRDPLKGIEINLKIILEDKNT